MRNTEILGHVTRMELCEISLFITKGDISVNIYAIWVNNLDIIINLYTRTPVRSCVHACVCVCMYVCTHTLTYVYMHVRKYELMNGRNKFCSMNYTCMCKSCSHQHLNIKTDMTRSIWLISDV
jgi:hypothetical protein